MDVGLKHECISPFWDLQLQMSGQTLKECDENCIGPHILDLCTVDPVPISPPKLGWPTQLQCSFSAENEMKTIKAVIRTLYIANTMMPIPAEKSEKSSMWGWRSG